ncbi:HPP family protein [Sinomonas humi]|uniref:HPP family protein n=1 Tax=Sinomonas humi TaxID=1338436 RepID=UPI001E5792EB|nr:HPP family protein [Sinomonas humi]
MSGQETGMLVWLTERVGPLGAGLYAGVLCLVVLTVAGIVGLGLHEPWLFPSLGPTAMMFFETPQAKAARPLDTLVGHGVALVVGIAMFFAFGLEGLPFAPGGSLTLGHVLAGALSVAVTTLILSCVKLPHPPAGATTLIVSLGILRGFTAWGTMAAAIVLLTVMGWGLNILLHEHPSPRTEAAMKR